MKKYMIPAVLTAGLLLANAVYAAPGVPASVNVSAAQIAAADIAEPSDFDYTVNHDGKGVTITKYKRKAFRLAFPEKINGLPITAIGDSAFFRNNLLTEVVIPDTVTSIGANAFWRCENLSVIHIPESVTEIGRTAFEYTPWFQEQRTSQPLVIVNSILISCGAAEGTVIVPDGVTTLADMAFYCGDMIEKIVLPDSIVTIGESVFEECTDLTEINIPDSVTAIGAHAFDHCIGLQTLTVPASVTAIGEDAFYNCLRLTVSVPAGSYAEEYFRENSIPFESIGTVSETTAPIVTTSLPNTTTTAPIVTTSLLKTTTTAPIVTTSLLKTTTTAPIVTTSLPNTTTTAPIVTTSLPKTTTTAPIVTTSLPKTTTTAPVITTSLPVVTTTAPEQTIPYANPDDFSYTVNADGVISITKYKGTDTELWIPAEINENPVGIISPYAFHDCDTLEEVHIPDGVKQIGASAFDGCSNLETVSVPPSVTEIGNGAFHTGGSVTIEGEPGSYAETYAKQKSLPFSADGDLNGDGTVNIADAVLLARFTAEDSALTAEQTKQLSAAKTDLDGDGYLTVSDLCVMLGILRKS